MADEVERHVARIRWTFRYLTGAFGWWSARSLFDEGSCVRAAALLHTGLVQLNQGLGPKDYRTNAAAWAHHCIEPSWFSPRSCPVGGKAEVPGARSKRRDLPKTRITVDIGETSAGPGALGEMQARMQQRD